MIVCFGQKVVGKRFLELGTGVIVKLKSLRVLPVVALLKLPPEPFTLYTLEIAFAVIQPVFSHGNGTPGFSN